MIEPAENPKEFERKVQQTPNIARVESESSNKYRVFLSSDRVQRMEKADSALEAVDSLIKRLRKLGASEVEIEGRELIVTYPTVA